MSPFTLGSIPFYIITSNIYRPDPSGYSHQDGCAPHSSDCHEEWKEVRHKQKDTKIQQDAGLSSQKYTPPGTRTQNLLLRRQMPYPLGQWSYHYFSSSFTHIPYTRGHFSIIFTTTIFRSCYFVGKSSIRQWMPLQWTRSFFSFCVFLSWLFAIFIAYFIRMLALLNYKYVYEMYLLFLEIFLSALACS